MYLPVAFHVNVLSLRIGDLAPFKFAFHFNVFNNVSMIWRFLKNFNVMNYVSVTFRRLSLHFLST